MGRTPSHTPSFAAFLIIISFMRKSIVDDKTYSPRKDFFSLDLLDVDAADIAGANGFVYDTRYRRSGAKYLHRIYRAL